MKCSIIIAAFVFAACRQNLKQESNVNNTGINKSTPELNKEAVLLVQNDSLISGHAGTGSKKPACCAAPPSRFKVIAQKK